MHWLNQAEVAKQLECLKYRGLADNGIAAEVVLDCLEFKFRRYLLNSEDQSLDDSDEVQLKNLK